jgi:hypothetical protein
MTPKFDKIYRTLITEMPHISFNAGGKFHTVDIGFEKYYRNYEGFLGHIQEIINNLNGVDGQDSQEQRKTFLQELHDNPQFVLYLQKYFNKRFDQFESDLV